MPQETISKVKNFYMLKFPTLKIYDEEQVLNDLPLGLQRLVRLELFKDVVESSDFFFGVDEQVYQQVCMCLVPTYKTELMEITIAGDIPDALYIVRFGVVSVTMHGAEVFEAHTGNVIGELALLGLSPDGRRQRTCIAKTMCELCKLNKDDFGYLLNIEAFRRPFRIMVQAHLANLEAVLAHDLPLEPHIMAHVDWTKLRKQIESARRREFKAGRSVDAMTVSIQRAISQHSSTSSELLITNVQLFFQSIRLEKGCDLGPSNRIVFAVAWPGHHAHNDPSKLLGLACRDFSDAVRLSGSEDGNSERDNGKVRLEVMAGVVLPVAHSNHAWDTMPPVRIVIYSVDDVGSWCPPEGHIPRLDNPDTDLHSSSFESISLESQAGLKYFAACHVRLQSIIEARQKHYSDPYAAERQRTQKTNVSCTFRSMTLTKQMSMKQTQRTAKIIGSMASYFRKPQGGVLEFAVSTFKNKMFTEDAIIGTAVTVNRQVAPNSRWRTLLSLIRRMAPSPWFLERQRKMLNNMRRSVHTVFVKAELDALIGEDMDAPCKRIDLERVNKSMNFTRKKLQDLTDSVSDLTKKTDAILNCLGQNLGAPIKMPAATSHETPGLWTELKRPEVIRAHDFIPNRSLWDDSSFLDGGPDDPASGPNGVCLLKDANSLGPGHSAEDSPSYSVEAGRTKPPMVEVSNSTTAISYVPEPAAAQIGPGTHVVHLSPPHSHSTCSHVPSNSFRCDIYILWNTVRDGSAMCESRCACVRARGVCVHV
jgi:CRP-like cAMP-binding protein